MRRLGRWFPKGIVAVERGDTFDDWTMRGSGVWNKQALDDYDHNLCNFLNNDGADEGAADWRKAYSTLGISNPTGYTASHTVHMRMTRSNRAAYVAIGPATALHASSGAGNGYCALATYPASVSSVEIRKVTNGTSAALIAAQCTVNEGDVLSLGYRYNTSASAAELSVLVNGVEITTASDLLSPYDMATLTARPGVWGDFFPTIASSRTIGQWFDEWWVTDLAGTFSEPAPRYPAGVGDVLLHLMKRQRFTDSDTPVIHRVISGQILSCKWTHNRIGGCGSMRVEFRYPYVRNNFAGSPSTYQEDASHELFHHPIAEDWNDSNWFGGDAILVVRWRPQDDEQNDDHLWRGRVTRISLDPDTKTITVEGDGLVQALDDVLIVREFENQPIWDGPQNSSILRTILEEHATKSGQADGRDNPVRYNASKVVGHKTVLSTRVSVSFNNDTALSAIKTLMGYLPSSIVWGVDRDGDFYLDQQLDTYDNDMTGAGFVTYVVDREAVRFERDLDFERVRNRITVTGREAEGADGVEANERGRIFASAVCDRSRELWGTREDVESEGGVDDVGLLGKVALARVKSSCAPAITGRLSVVQRVVGQRSFYQALRRDSPRVGVIDRPQIDVSGKLPIGYSALYGSGAIGSAGARTGPYMLRRFGDAPAYAIAGQGSAGLALETPSSSAEQALDTGWLLHIAIRTDFAHPGGTDDFAYIVGRCGGTTSTDFGWGGLWWHKTGATTGKLVWAYTSAGAAQRSLDTTISLNPAGGETVLFTIHRDYLGVFRVYDGTTLKATEAGWTADVLQNNGAVWRWFNCDTSGLDPNFIEGDFACDQFYVQTTKDSTGQAIEDQQLAVAGFLSRNNDVELRRCDGHGLLLYGPFKWTPGPSVPMQRGTTLVTADASGGSLSQADKVTANVAMGQLVTNDASTTKRWGGAMIFEAESCTYDVDPASGLVRKDYTLGEPRSDAILALATVKEQVRRIEDTQRKTKQDF